jgi:hypothetical protein
MHKRGIICTGRRGRERVSATALLFLEDRRHRSDPRIRGRCKLHGGAISGRIG